MTALRVQLDTRDVVRNFRRLPGELSKVEAREINRQMRTSIGGTGSGRVLPVKGMARRMRDAWNITPSRNTPLKAIRKRMFLPKGAQAKPNRLTAIGLTLFEALPMRYFSKGIPSGAQVLDSGVDRQGREPFGAPFTATMQSGATGEFRKLRPKKWSSKGRRNENPKGWLPIGWAKYVDISDPAYRIRHAVLTDLARHFPRQMDEAFRKALPKIMAGRRA